MALRTPITSEVRRTTAVRAGAATGERLRLNPFDLLTGPIYTPMTLFYRKTLDPEALRDSLGRTLARYPMLSGRLLRDSDGGLSVVCNDGGVSFTEAASPDPMLEYGPGVRTNPMVGNMAREVTPFRVVGRDTPLLKVRLTQMAGGGSVLGVAINHTLADGYSGAVFLEDWSREHLGLPYPERCHDRHLLDELARPADSPKVTEGRDLVRVSRVRHLTASIAAASKRMATVATRFSAAEVSRLKEAAMADLAGTDRWISSSDALTARVWQVVTELRGRPDSETEWLCLLARAQPRLGGQLPEEYWGNCVTSCWTGVSTARVRSESLGALALTVRGCVERNTEEKIRDDLAFIAASRRDGVSRRVLSRMVLRGFGGALSANNWSHFPMYRVDLGGGRPFWYEFPDVPVPTMHVLPTPAEDGGRDVYLCLVEDQARTLGQSAWLERLHSPEAGPASH